MARRVFQALAIVLAVSLVAVVSFAAGATGGSGDGDSGKSGESLWQRMHEIGARLHQHGPVHGHGGGGEFAHHLGDLVNQLDLTPVQTERLEAVHRSLGSHGGGVEGSMAELHEQLVAQFEQGHVETDGIRQTIDQHLEQMRATAYSVTDEAVALLNSLDADQRGIVLAHIRAAHDGSMGHGR